MSKNPGKRSDRRASRLSDHSRNGKSLTPPYMTLPGGMRLASWRDDRLPSILWAALLANELDRDKYLQIFRDLAIRAFERRDINCDGMGHPRLAVLSNAEFDFLFQDVTRDKSALQALLPLMLLDNLPDRSHWQRHLSEKMDTEACWNRLAGAVGQISWHQSQTATDIRWMKLLCLIASDKMKFAKGMEEQIRSIRDYPDYGDMRMVRPSIRAAEVSFSDLDDDLNSDWHVIFWKDCLRLTSCANAPFKAPPKFDVSTCIDEAVELYKEIDMRFHQSLSTTDVDAKLDSVYGLLLYLVNIHLSILRGNSHQRIEGRYFIRVMAEIHITLSYLMHVDNPATWLKYRVYGHGQAKLAYLKLIDLESDQVPSYIVLDELEELANEDRWQEFVEIDLGNWSKQDLRRMSEEAGVKDIYDRYYTWPSSYVHARWGAVRDTVFTHCLNPLHRFHRIPNPPRIDMASVSNDAIKLVNITLDLLSKAYPPFKMRLKAKGLEIPVAPSDQ